MTMPAYAAQTEDSTSDVRSDDMYLMNEEMARARSRELFEEAQRFQRVRRLEAARRMERRAARAAVRARRLAAAAIAAADRV